MSETRKALVRKCDAAIHSQERCAEHLQALYDMYKPDYPDLALQVKLISRSVFELRDLLGRFRRERM